MKEEQLIPVEQNWWQWLWAKLTVMLMAVSLPPPSCSILSLTSRVSLALTGCSALTSCPARCPPIPWSCWWWWCLTIPWSLSSCWWCDGGGDVWRYHGHHHHALTDSGSPGYYYPSFKLVFQKLKNRFLHHISHLNIMLGFKKNSEKIQEK